MENVYNVRVHRPVNFVSELLAEFPLELVRMFAPVQVDILIHIPPMTSAQVKFIKFNKTNLECPQKCTSCTGLTTCQECKGTLRVSLSRLTANICGCPV